MSEVVFIEGVNLQKTGFHKHGGIEERTHCPNRWRLILETASPLSHPSGTDPEKTSRPPFLREGLGGGSATEICVLPPKTSRITRERPKTPMASRTDFGKTNRPTASTVAITFMEIPYQIPSSCQEYSRKGGARRQSYRGHAASLSESGFIGSSPLQGNHAGTPSQEESGPLKGLKGSGRHRLRVECRDFFLSCEPVCLKVAVGGPDQPAGNICSVSDSAPEVRRYGWFTERIS